MQTTKLLYLENFSLLSSEAKVLSVEKIDEKTVIILDQTVFYPQGGGQPFDQGQISSDDAVFFVEEVRFVDGFVHHIGHFDHGNFEVDQKVGLEIDQIRRNLHSRLHSGGHVVDMALKQLQINWKPGKGYHFPQGPYVEYEGELGETDREVLKNQIEQACNKIISEDAITKLEFISPVQAEDRGMEVPGNIVESGKPIRIVFYGEFGILCGGTHVGNLSEIGEMTIRKIKPEGKNIRVGYDVK